MSKIGNEVVQVDGGFELNDKDYCTCLLSTLKEIEKNTCVAMTEASNEWLYDYYKEMFINLSDLQRRLFELMFQNGWYQLENVDASKIDDKYHLLEKDYKSLSQ
ncbi:MAG: spore coat protein [Bacilli bacterium]|nr:spore coat protein [Bacilli bacterium]